MSETDNNKNDSNSATQSDKSGRDSDVKVAKLNLMGVIITSTVTLVVGITAALFAPLIIDYVRSLQNATPTSTPPIATPLAYPFTETFTPGSIVTVVPIVTETFTPSPALPPTLTQPPDAGVMTAQISSNYYDGKAPFTSTFRAGTSFVTYQDGRVDTCEFTNVCSYTWDVREKNGATIHGPEVGGKEFSFTFARPGEYTVVVYVCRGQACNFTAANVTAR